MNKTEVQEVLVERKESQSSYEIGKPGERFKLYFWTPEELVAKLEDLRNRGLLPPAGVDDGSN